MREFSEMRESEREWTEVNGRGRRRSPHRRNLGRRQSTRYTTSRHPNISPSRHLTKPPSRLLKNPFPRHFTRSGRVRSPSPQRSIHHKVRNARSSRRRSSSDFHCTSFPRVWGQYKEEAEDRGKKKNSYFSSLEKEGCTYFFTNFPEDIEMKNLWRIFGKIGAVGDVALPLRRDIRRRRFRFVRFKPSEDRARLDTTIQNMFIGNWKITVNKPKFSRGILPLIDNFPCRAGAFSVVTAVRGVGGQGAGSNGRKIHGSWSDVVRFGKIRSDLTVLNEAEKAEVRNIVGCNVPLRLVAKPVEIDFSLDIPDSLVIKSVDCVVADLEFV